MVQGSKVLSPATFKVRPLNGISTEPIFDAGRAAVLHKKLKSSAAHPAFTASGKVGI